MSFFIPNLILREPKPFKFFRYLCSLAWVFSMVIMSGCGGGSSGGNTASSPSAVSSLSSLSSSSESSSSSLSSSESSSSADASSATSSTATGVISTGRYKLRARHSGMLMDVESASSLNGAKIIQWPDTGGVNQQFDVIDLHNGYFAIIPADTVKSLDVWNFSLLEGGEIRQYDYGGGYNQQWQITALDGGYLSIVSRLSGKALSLTGNSVESGAQVVQMDYQGQDSQQWQLEPVASAHNYQLVWSEEFNYTGLPDTSYWNYEQGMVRNNEFQYYTVARPENVNVANGLLTITARRENYMGAAYTSTSLNTWNKLSWTYGRFELRARIDTRAGLWPAFWMVGGGKWPEGGEIDIMEYYQNHILANVAWKANNTDPWSAAWDSSTRSLDQLHLQDPDWDNQFHIWRMDWDADAIRLYVDDVPMNITWLSTTINPDGSNPFRDKPQAILINLAIGGNNGGDPSATLFPATYEIDYLRVYQ